MFEVEIKNLKVFANIGITAEERKKKQLLKVTLNFSYSVQKNKNLEKMSNLKSYSEITQSLKKFINENDSYVLSLGGGTPCYANNINIISQEADVYSIYLQGSVTTIYERLKINSSKRPLIASLKKDSLIEYIAKHLFERSVYYEKAKHRISINSKGIDDIVAEIRILLH